MNPYFAFEDPEVIDDVEKLLSLNLEKTYYRPGAETPITDIFSAHSLHQTAGIFRGQLNDWPLIPKSYRAIAYPTEEITPIVRSFRWRQATREFWNFCERAEIQNPAFPSSLSDRMSIAQHFGVSTPLLDWSQNIFTAIFFAVRDVYANKEFENSLRVFVYHIIDERLLHAGIPEDSNLADFDHSAFVKPYPIERRIERQRGVFTYHPYPTHRPGKVSARMYILEWPLIEKLIALMKGFGFTEGYFFPDYAGIANAVMSDTTL
jgi:hypothetical protein